MLKRVEWLRKKNDGEKEGILLAACASEILEVPLRLWHPSSLKELWKLGSGAVLCHPHENSIELGADTRLLGRSARVVFWQPSPGERLPAPGRCRLGVSSGPSSAETFPGQQLLQSWNRGKTWLVQSSWETGQGLAGSERPWHPVRDNPQPGRALQRLGEGAIFSTRLRFFPDGIICALVALFLSLRV